MTWPCITDTDFHLINWITYFDDSTNIKRIRVFTDTYEKEDNESLHGDGQGVVYKNIKGWLDKVSKRYFFPGGKKSSGIRKIYLIRKTNKMTEAAVRFRGWKGKR